MLLDMHGRASHRPAFRSLICMALIQLTNQHFALLYVISDVCMLTRLTHCTQETQVVS